MTFKEQKKITKNYSIAEYTVNDNLLIYPNPITDNATMKLPDMIEIKQIDIINVYGKTERLSKTSILILYRFREKIYQLVYS